jgi:hypothetical protein
MIKSTKTAASPKKLSKSVGKSKDDFRALYDKNFIVPTKIKQYLAALGPRTWETEKEMCSKAGISTTDISAFRSQFEEYIVLAREPGKHPQTLWCGSKSFATELKGMVGAIA